MTINPEETVQHDQRREANRRQILEIIKSGSVKVVFQPIVDVSDGLIIAYEALSRPGPETGFTRPDDMFEAAADAGLLWELEQATRSSALSAASDWPRDVRLFLNNSPTVFADTRFSDTLQRDLAKSRGVDADRVVLEITEMAQTTNDDKLVAQISRVKTAGFQVAVDDAGAGTSGLNRMMVIRPQWIKLDRQFCRGIDADPLRQNLVRFFTHFARISGVNVVAEGIESASELAALIGLGVRYAQGYFLARPGDRASTMDPEFVNAVRERWASVEASVPTAPIEMPLMQLCKPVATHQADELTARSAAGLLKTSDDQQGLVLLVGRRLLGWVSRSQVMALGLENPNELVSSVCASAPHTLPPDATVQDALRSVSQRDDHQLGEPLLVVNGSEVVGVIPVRELLRCAAADQRQATSTKALLTGLPTRVRADQHLEEMLVRAADPIVRMSAAFHSEAAFVDVRGFADYNSAFGYETGDRLIRELGHQLRAVVVGQGEHVYLAHLGDDRFLLTAPAGTLRSRLDALIQVFDKGGEGGGGEITEPGVLARIGENNRLASNGRGVSMGLRVLMLPGVFLSANQPRDIYRAEQLLRQHARIIEQAIPPGQSLLLVEGVGSSAKSARSARQTA